MSIKPEDLQLENVLKTLRTMKTWKEQLTSINVSPESVAAVYDKGRSELKGTLATETTHDISQIKQYFKRLLDQTSDGKIGVTFNSIAPNTNYDGCVGHYMFDFLNKDQEKTELAATFEFKSNKAGDLLAYHHSYKGKATPEKLSNQLPDDYQDFEDGEPDALDSIDLG